MKSSVYYVSNLDLENYTFCYKNLLKTLQNSYFLYTLLYHVFKLFYIFLYFYLVGITLFCRFVSVKNNKTKQNESK